MDKLPAYFSIVIDIDTELDESRNPFYSKFIDTHIDSMKGLGSTIKTFLDFKRDFMVLHYTPEETDKLGYFDRNDCLIFG